MDGALLTLLVALSLLPPLLYALHLRAREQHDREPVRAVLGTFLWGGTIGVAVALILHLVFEFGYQQAGSPLAVSAGFFAAVIAAPIVEEMAKGFGLRGIKHHLSELEDGIIYGAALGLGFAATENLVYGLAGVLDGGFGVGIGTVVIRTFSSMLLHASASAIVGFGYGRAVVEGRGGASILPYYLAAVGLHALYNFLVGMDALLGLAIGILLVAFVVTLVRKKIESLDIQSMR